MSKNTMVELVTELEKLTDTSLRDRLVKEALEGSFHDFRSKSACGKMYFVECAQWFYANIGKVNPASNEDINKMRVMESDVKNGVYDEPCTLEDRKLLAEELNDPNCEMTDKDKDFFASCMGISKKKSPYGWVFYYVK